MRRRGLLVLFGVMLALASGAAGWRLRGMTEAAANR